MATFLLLVIIYLAFISLGLPDSLLGVAWPVIRIDFGLPLDAAGIISLVTVGVTVLSSLANGYIVRKLGTGPLTLISCLMTAGALLGISVVPSFWWIIPLAIPLGFGAGSVDASLNNYVAHHFRAHHMNWLHSFWGLGATFGPVIMGQYLLSSSWRDGYKAIGLIQLGLALILLISLPLWQRHEASDEAAEANHIMASEPDPNPLKLKGVSLALLTFVFYVTAEMSVGLWGSSYLVQSKAIEVGVAASWVAMYFGGITIGRFISGFISFKLNNQQMIRSGILISMTGTILILLPLPNPILMAAFVLIGLGFAPIFPGMIHETPTRFGKNNSGVIIGFQMAAAYAGAAVFPPLGGVLFKNISTGLFPLFIFGFILLQLWMTEWLNRIPSRADQL